MPESEMPIFVNLELSPEILLVDLKEQVKEQLHPNYTNLVSLEGHNFTIKSKDDKTLKENGIYDNCTLISY